LNQVGRKGRIRSGQSLGLREPVPVGDVEEEGEGRRTGA